MRTHVLGFRVELALIFFREMAVVFGDVALLVFLEAFFAALEMTAFCGRELPFFRAAGDSFLLIGFTVIDLGDARMPRIYVRGRGSGFLAVLSLGRS
jgi:hypothetical protein